MIWIPEVDQWQIASIQEFADLAIARAEWTQMEHYDPRKDYKVAKWTGPGTYAIRKQVFQKVGPL